MVQAVDVRHLCPSETRAPVTSAPFGVAVDGLRDGRTTRSPPASERTGPIEIGSGLGQFQIKTVRCEAALPVGIEQHLAHTVPCSRVDPHLKSPLQKSSKVYWPPRAVPDARSSTCSGVHPDRRSTRPSRAVLWPGGRRPCRARKGPTRPRVAPDVPAFGWEVADWPNDDRNKGGGSLSRRDAPYCELLGAGALEDHSTNCCPNGPFLVPAPLPEGGGWQSG